MKRRLLSCGLAVFLAGCAGTPVPVQNALTYFELTWPSVSPLIYQDINAKLKGQALTDAQTAETNFNTCYCGLRTAGTPATAQKALTLLTSIVNASTLSANDKVIADLALGLLSAAASGTQTNVTPGVSLTTSVPPPPAASGTH